MILRYWLPYCMSKSRRLVKIDPFMGYFHQQTLEGYQIERVFLSMHPGTHKKYQSPLFDLIRPLRSHCAVDGAQDSGLGIGDHVGFNFQSIYLVYPKGGH